MAENDLFDDYLRRAQHFIDSGRIDSEEMKYKLEIVANLRRARGAVLSGHHGWSALVKKALINHHLSHWSYEHPFSEWFDTRPEDALSALRVLWADDDTPPGERVRAFVPRIPGHQNRRGVGMRLAPVSVLLMALGLGYPPFRMSALNRAYDRTGHPRPPRGADEGAVYEHALAFFDLLVARSAGRPHNRLEAQSIVWLMQRETEARYEDPAATARPAPEPTVVVEPAPASVAPPVSLEALAEELRLDVGFLYDIEQLLDDKHQVIFRGPPGTGKTLIACKLAECLAGAAERLRIVRFHATYTYEDFVQGYRPGRTAGRAGIVLQHGPLLDMAAMARAEPGAKHFLVMDDIDRGNIAEVFGDLYILLEYRDEDMPLQYSGESFSLPPNLFFIGTMNTADRSIALVDLALRRRFHFVDFHPGQAPVTGRQRAR